MGGERRGRPPTHWVSEFPFSPAPPPRVKGPWGTFSPKQRHGQHERGHLERHAEAVPANPDVRQLQHRRHGRRDGAGQQVRVGGWRVAEPPQEVQATGRQGPAAKGVAQSTFGHLKSRTGKAADQERAFFNDPPDPPSIWAGWKKPAG